MDATGGILRWSYGHFPVVFFLRFYCIMWQKVDFCQRVYSNYMILLEVESVFWPVTEEVRDFRGVQRIQHTLTSSQEQMQAALTDAESGPEQRASKEVFHTCSHKEPVYPSNCSELRS